jgi:hypothetical protein
MKSATISLNKKSYPLMMHLSILPKYRIESEAPTYNPATQSSNFSTAMSGSWSTRANSSNFLFPDDDSKEDD